MRVSGPSLSDIIMLNIQDVMFCHLVNPLLALPSTLAVRLCIAMHARCFGRSAHRWEGVHILLHNFCIPLQVATKRGEGFILLSKGIFQIYV